MNRNTDPRYRHALDQLPPESCPFLLYGTEIRMRLSVEAPWESVVVYESDSQGQMTLVSLLLQALYSGRALELVDLAGRREVYRHADPCPQCQHDAAPGPRVYAHWHTSEYWAAEMDQGWRRTDQGDLRNLLELPNAAKAARWAEQVGRWYAQGKDERTGRAELYPFVVPADPGRLSDYRCLGLEAGAELWIWDALPTRPNQLRAPDRVYRMDADGSVAEYTRAQARKGRRTLQPPGQGSTLFRTEASPDGARCLTWFEDGGKGLLVSVRDLRSTAPAVRVVEDGQEQPLGDSVPGLVVFGSSVADRPALSQIGRLAPGFADLVPQRRRS